MKSALTPKTIIAAPGRYHPLLPTISEVKQQFEIKRQNVLEENSSPFISDHLPLISKIPFKVSATQDHLVLITFNAHAPVNFDSGFDANETDFQMESRANLTIEKLNLIIEIQNPDLICLQEDYFSKLKNKEIETKLTAMLAEKGFVFKKHDRGIRSIYRKKATKKK